MKTRKQSFFPSTNISENSRVNSSRKTKKKCRKNSISNTEFNAFYQAFEQHSKQRVDKSNPTVSGPSTVNSGMASSPESLQAKRRGSKMLSKHKKKKTISPQKVLQNLEGDSSQNLGKFSSKFSWKMSEIVDSLTEIEKGFE